MKSVSLIRSVLLACLCWTGPACAAPEGRETLRNGAILVWNTLEIAEPRLSLAVPAFARWQPDGFAEPVEIRIGASSLASIDAWEVAFHRSGDTAFDAPIHRIRGTALAFPDRVSWDGAVDGGPPLRPGETVLAVLSVRDVAGNIDRATPQEILVARYIMRRERRRIGAQETGRDAAFAAGETPKPRAIPSRGRSVYLRIENWPEDDDPLLAGVPLHREGSAWVLRQNLPGGIYDLVVQVARPMLGGVRAIPVGVARLTVPQDQPLMARVKGTGMLDRIDGDDPIPKGWKSDGWIDGADAARLVMIDRDVSEDRLAVALVDPSRPTALVKDRRKRRSLVVSPDPATALWAGQGTPTSPTRPPAKPRTRRVTVHFAGPMPTELILPHTDILRGSLTIEPEDGTAPFAPVRDFFANPAQGRVLMTENALSRFDAERNTPLRVQYDIDAFAPRLLDTDTLTAGGIANATTWGTTGERHHDAAASRKSERGLIERIIRWFGG